MQRTPKRLYTAGWRQFNSVGPPNVSSGSKAVMAIAAVGHRFIFKSGHRGGASYRRPATPRSPPAWRSLTGTHHFAQATKWTRFITIRDAWSQHDHYGAQREEGPYGFVSHFPMKRSVAASYFQG